MNDSASFNNSASFNDSASFNNSASFSDVASDGLADPGASALLAGTAPAASDLERLGRRLADAAEDAELLDVAYTTIDSPLGPLLLAATEKGLVRVAYPIEDHEQVLEMLAEKLSPRVLRAPKRLDAAAREIEQYFAGSRRNFDLALDLSLSRGFRQLVQRHLPEIAYGRTESYGEVARLVGNPKAVRAVGTACATNPLPIVIPCHRVLRSDGSLGGYAGGVEAKTALLALESAA